MNNPFQPKLNIGKRRKIYDFLREKIAPFIYLRVENPIYEPMKLAFNVGFHKVLDEGHYGLKLHHDLQAFLSPWAFESEWKESTHYVFGYSLRKSVILILLKICHMLIL